MKKKLKECLWIHIFVPLAILLVRIGITRHRWLWQVVYFFSPRTAGFCIIMEDSMMPENTLLWYWQEGDHEEDMESVKATLADIDEMINRAPVPFGGDDFIIMIRKYGALPEEKHLYNFDHNEDVERFLNNHSLTGAWNHRGSRWRDWKRGEAKMRLFNTLIKAEPNSIEPLTIIGVVIIGRGVARSILLSQGKTPSF